MNTDLTIRRYEPEDAEAVLSVREDSLIAHGWEFQDTRPSPQEVTDEYLVISSGVLEAGSEFLIGLGGRNHGHRRVQTPGNKLRLNWSGWVFARIYQLKGHGARMLEALEERAVSSGFTRIVPDTFERLVIAKWLYGTFGYRKIGRDTYDRNGEGRIRYSKELQVNRD